MTGQIVSHYRILEKLGEGGMGVVYTAEDTHLGRRVAIKFLSAAADGRHYRARFLREARAVSALSHPNIAAVYDYGETSGGEPFIVMELVNGKPLNELLHESSLTIARAMQIIESVAEALSEAHSRGIIHRDIKPSNVIVGERGQVKVLDFGLVKQLNDEQGFTSDQDAPTLLVTRTRSDVVVGTPLYLSPEQATSAPVDARSDLFALGALLYECITGRPAFAGTSVIEIGAQIIYVDPPPPSQINPRVPRELDRITLKALAKRPEDRYQSAEEMSADLHAVRSLLRDDDQRIARLSVASRMARSSALVTLSDVMRRPRLSIGFFLVALAIAGIAFWAVVRWWRPTPHKPSAVALDWYNKGTDALRNGAYYQATKALEQAISADDKYALAHAALAEAWMEMDYADKAKDELLRVAALVPDRSIYPQLEKLYLDAITATVTRDFARAIESYREIARLTPDQPQVYVDLGRAYERSDQVKEAIESYVEATNRASQYATPFLRVGYLYGRQQDMASAVAAFDKAEVLYQALGNIEGQAEVLYQRGFLFNNLGKVAEARAPLQRALDIARATGNQYQQIKTLLKLGDVATSEGHLAQAQQYAREAVDLAQAKGIDFLTERGLVDLGNTFLVSGDYGEAENYFKQSLELARRHKGQRNEARALLSLGSLRERQNNPDEAVRYIEQALPFYQQGGFRKETSQALTLLARANILRGDYDAALKAFQRQLQLAEQVGDQLQVAFSHDGIGLVLAKQERYPEALGHFEESHAIEKSLGNQPEVRTNLTERGDVLWQLGRYDEARTVLGQAPYVAERPNGDYKRQSSYFYVTIARMALSGRRFSEAAAKSQQALALAGTQFKDNTILAKFTLGLARVFSGAAREGRQSCEEAVAMATRTGDPWLLSKSQLALAEAVLESGDAQDALSNALGAKEAFARSGQQDSEWRAWLIAARASHRAGDVTKAREYASHAADLLSDLQQRWGAENYNTYLMRPDIQYCRRQLNEELSVR